MPIEHNLTAAPNPLGNYDELHYDVLHQDIRIFIQGAEVTNDLIGSVSVHLEKGVGSNNVHFELDNALDKYILTEVNLPEATLKDPDNNPPVFSSAEGKYSEIAKRDIYNFKNSKTRAAINNQKIGNQLNTIYLDAGGSDAFNKAEDKTGFIQNLANETVANLPQEFFVNPNNPEKTTEIDKEPYPGFSPSVKSAFNTSNAVYETLKKNFPSSSDNDLRTIADNAVTGRMDKTIPETENPTIPDTKLNVVDPYTGSYRWDFSPGDCVITQLDPVVVYAANPLAEPDRNQWFCVFTGFISDVQMSKDHVTGASTITAAAQDIRFLINKMRVNSNTITGIKDPEVVYTDSAGIFKDMITDTGGRTVQFSGKPFSDALTQVLTGYESLQEALDPQKERTAASDATSNGIGGLRVHTVAYYPVEGSNPSYTTLVSPTAVPSSVSTSVATGEATLAAASPTPIGLPPVPVADKTGSPSVKLLDHWHTLTLLGPDMDFLTYEECTLRGHRTVTGDEQFDPMNKGINILLPRKGTELTNVVEFGIIHAGLDKYNFKTRAEIISSMLSITNYVFYVAPHGDLVFEFPFYDFIPEDFGSWSNVFTFNNHLLGSSVTYENPDVTTGIVVSGNYSEFLPQDVQVNQTVLKEAKVVIWSPKLASRYGAKIGSESIPFTSAKDQIASYGMFKFQEMLGSANSFSMETVFRPFLLPNRPVVNVPDNKMGVLSSIDNVWNIFESCTTKYGLTYIRTKRRMMIEDSLQDAWVFLTGSPVMGISYRYGYGIAGGGYDQTPQSVTKIPGLNISGIRIYPEDAAVNTPNSAYDEWYANKSNISNAELKGLSPTERTMKCDPKNGLVSSQDDLSKFSPKTLSDIKSICIDSCVTMYVTIPLPNEKPSVVSAQETSFSVRIRQINNGPLVYSKEEKERLVASANKLGYSTMEYPDHIVFTPAPGLLPKNYDSAEVEAIKDQRKKRQEAARAAAKAKP